MPIVVGVRFRRAGKIYYFDPGGLDLKFEDKAVVETARGLEFGEVVIAPREVSEDNLVLPLKTVIRIGTEEDIRRVEENQIKQKEAFSICTEKIREHELPMKLIDVEYTFDNSKIIFYFTAEGRVDFRELVKNLAAIFRTRIELRQIGVRDEAKMVGGIGGCGRVLCCHAFLGDFEPVSIRMAKDQNLSLNPTKISGICGRLMCCLKYENEAYENMKTMQCERSAKEANCGKCSCPMQNGDYPNSTGSESADNLTVDESAVSNNVQINDNRKSKDNPGEKKVENSFIEGDRLQLSSDEQIRDNQSLKIAEKPKNNSQQRNSNRYGENGPKKIENSRVNESSKQNGYPKGNEASKESSSRRSKDNPRPPQKRVRDGVKLTSIDQLDDRQFQKNGLSRNQGTGNLPTRKPMLNRREDQRLRSDNQKGPEAGTGSRLEQANTVRTMTVRSRNVNSHPTGGQSVAHNPSDLGD